MEPENQPLEKEIPIGNHHFEVPCKTFGVYILWKSSPTKLKESLGMIQDHRIPDTTNVQSSVFGLSGHRYMIYTNKQFQYFVRPLRNKKNFPTFCINLNPSWLNNKKPLRSSFPSVFVGVNPPPKKMHNENMYFLKNQKSKTLPSQCLLNLCLRGQVCVCRLYLHEHAYIYIYHTNDMI